MDLATEAERLRLDLLAVAVSDRLTGGGVPHALIKGPSTANWLWTPPRRYRDVDVLVPLSRLDDAVATLAADGLATAAAGRVGEEAEHSLLLHSQDGFEIDLHISLPAVPPDGDRVWTALADHVVDLDLGVGTLRALDEPGRCLVLALHALANPRVDSQPVDDLRRARAAAAPASWVVARRLAATSGVVALFEAGLSTVDAAATGPGTPRARLYVAGAPGSALGLQRLSEQRRRDLPRAIGREIVPSSGFMSHADPDLAAGRITLPRAHLRRWRRLLAGLPAALAAWLRARG